MLRIDCSKGPHGGQGDVVLLGSYAELAGCVYDIARGRFCAVPRLWRRKTSINRSSPNASPSRRSASTTRRCRAPARRRHRVLFPKFRNSSFRIDRPRCRLAPMSPHGHYWGSSKEKHDRNRHIGVCRWFRVSVREAVDGAEKTRGIAGRNFAPHPKVRLEVGHEERTGDSFAEISAATSPIGPRPSSTRS